MSPTRSASKLKNMLSYVPQMVVSQYLDNPHLESPADAKPENFPASVLFVDISGKYYLSSAVLTIIRVHVSE